VDYNSGPYPVIFPAGVTSVTFDVPITDDNILEGSEKFMLTVDQSSLPDYVFHGNPGEATVTIVDDDHKYKCIVLIKSEILVMFSFAISIKPYTC